MYDSRNVLLGLGTPWNTLAQQRLNQLKLKLFSSRRATAGVYIHRKREAAGKNCVTSDSHQIWTVL